MATDHAAQLGQLVEFLKQGRGDVRLDDVMELAQRMARSLDQAVASTDALLYKEFQAILGEIGTLRQELSEIGPDHFRFDRIPEAGRELDAVVESTAEASDTIMACAEEIMAADASDPEAYKAFIDEKMILIFEACSFQDLTGQRIRKVCRTLTWIEERAAGLAAKLNFAGGGAAVPEPETEEEQRMREMMVNGPQMKGEGVSQSAVDNFFSKSDQDDIDRLFG